VFKLPLIRRSLAATRAAATSHQTVAGD